MLKLLITPTFKRSIKKFHPNKKRDLDAAIKLIMEQPLIGEYKKGDLNHIRVYKFKLAKQLALLAYTYDKSSNCIVLLAIGSYENFYKGSAHKHPSSALCL